MEERVFSAVAEKPRLETGEQEFCPYCGIPMREGNCGALCEQWIGLCDECVLAREPLIGLIDAEVK